MDNEASVREFILIYRFISSVDGVARSHSNFFSSGRSDGLFLLLL